MNWVTKSYMLAGAESGMACLANLQVEKNVGYWSILISMMILGVSFIYDAIKAGEKK